MYPKTIHSVNKKLRELNIPVRAVSGGSYYYWLDTEGNIIEGTESVLVYRANHLTLDRWVEEAIKAEKCLVGSLVKY